MFLVRSCFNILINTQYDALKDLFCELSQYAEDSAVWKSGRSKSHLVYLVQKIDIIKQWAETLGIKISTGKTEVVIYNHQGTPNKNVPKLNIGDKTLEFKTEAKFLGITFDSQLSWGKHITEVVCRCKKDRNLMRYLSGTKFGADKLRLLAIYKTLIRSKIDYGCQAYASAPKTQLLWLDRIQSAALRIVTGAYKSTANTDVQIECSIQPLSLRREELILKYWARSWPINQQLPLNSLYDLSLYDTTKDRLKGKISFVMKVRELMDKYQLKRHQDSRTSLSRQICTKVNKT